MEQFYNIQQFYDLQHQLASNQLVENTFVEIVRTKSSDCLQKTYDIYHTYIAHIYCCIPGTHYHRHHDFQLLSKVWWQRSSNLGEVGMSLSFISYFFRPIMLFWRLGSVSANTNTNTKTQTQPAEVQCKKVSVKVLNNTMESGKCRNPLITIQL